MILIEVCAPVSGTPAGCKCLITRERILVGRVSPNTRFIKSADATIKCTPKPNTCDKQEIKAIKGEINKKECAAKGVHTYTGTDLVSMEPKSSKQSVIVRENKS